MLVKDEIIEMAKQAGIIFGYPAYHDRIEVFAKLVRNDYSNKHAQLWLKRIDEAVKAEREACAKVCEELVIEVVGNSALAVDQCAKTIRARSKSQ
jgi:hypothetical protein